MAKGSSDQVRVAVVEDDAELREEILLPLLRGSGFEATGLGSALALYRDLVARHYDLVLVDIGLPDEDGLAITRHLRQAAPMVGLVILSGHTSDGDKLLGLAAGADAYLTKPVFSDTLLTTLRNLAQRVRGGGDERAASSWKLDDRGWRIVLPDGQAVSLTLAEQQVVRLLAAVPGRPVRRDVLIAGLTEVSANFDPHRLEMLIHRLRRKCFTSTGVELPLRSVRGVGYVLAW